MKGYIYRIENKINGKNYIGKTYDSLEKRWKEHLRDSKRYTERPLYRAINKYGSENFIIIEVEYCDNCEEREKYWISYYDSYHNGYNATLGGDGRPYLEIEDSQIIKKYLETKSLKATKEFFNCSIKSIKNRLISNGFTDFSNDIYNEKRSWKTKKISQYSLNNYYLRSFDSQSKAAEWILQNNYSNGNIKNIVCNISRAARGIENRKQAYGFIWKYNMESELGGT